jgi:putative ABC transport system substrate-binding protein
MAAASLRSTAGRPGSSMNKRRILLGAIGIGALIHGVPALAQKPPGALRKIKRIGFLALRSRPASWDNDYYGSFLKRLAELGYVEDKNVVFDWRFAEGKVDRLQELANGLAQGEPDVIVTSGTAATRAAQRATDKIPIVMAVAADPKTSGFITELARPGRNVTGVARASVEVSPKYLELTITAVPNLTRVAVLLNPDSEFYSPRLKAIFEAARAANVRVQRVEARTPGEIESGFKIMAIEEVQAVIVPLEPQFVQYRRQLALAALGRRLPTVFGVREHVEAGGLMSYGQNLGRLYRRAATYVDKILRGAKPSELPVVQPSKFELTLNLKTAKALGLEIPEKLLASADRIFQ